MKAIERLIALEKSVTGLEKYEAVYTTRTNMTVTLVEVPFAKFLSAVFDAKTVGGGIVVLSMERLQDLKRLVIEAKGKLDSLKAVTK